MTSPWFMSKQGASKQGTQTQASKFGSKRWIVQLLPIAVSIFLVAALLTYHLRLHENAGPDASGWVQGLVVVIYDFFGFAPAMVLALLGMAWSSIAFFAGKLDRPGVITARVLTFVVCLAILGNLGGEGRGALGAYLAEPLRSVYWLSMIVITGATLVSAFLATDFFFYRYFEGGGFEVAGTSSSTASPRVIAAASRPSQESVQGGPVVAPSGALGSEFRELADDRLSAAADLSAEDQLDAEITRLATLASDAMSAEAEAEAELSRSEISDSRSELEGEEGVGSQELDQLKSLDLSADALPRPAEDLGVQGDSDELPLGRAARRRLRLREYSQQEVEPDALDLDLTEPAPAPIDALRGDSDGFEPSDGEGSGVDAAVIEETGADEAGTEESDVEGIVAGEPVAGEPVAGEPVAEISRAVEVEAQYGIDEDHIASAVDEVVRDLHRAVEEGSAASELVGEEAEIAREAEVSEVQFPRYETYTSALDAPAPVTPPRTSDGSAPADFDSHEDAFEHAAPEEHASIDFDPDATEHADGYEAHVEAGQEDGAAITGADDADSQGELGLVDGDADQDMDLVGYQQADLVATTAAQRFGGGDEPIGDEADDELQASTDQIDVVSESSAERSTDVVDVPEGQLAETPAREAETGPDALQSSADEEVFEFEYEEESELPSETFGSAEAEGCTDPVTDEIVTDEAATDETPATEDYVLPRPDPEFVAARQGELFGLAEEDADLLEEAASLVRETGRANANFFRRRLRISTDEAKAVLAQLAEQGLIEYELGAVQGRVITDEAH